ncbi:quinone oxidoreductase-like protein 1 isoform X2 [Glandiceps talaboti]
MRRVYVQTSAQSGVTECIFEQNAEEPTLTDNSIKIQIKTCGLTAFNLEIFQELNMHRGKYPFGREVSGIVIQAGSAVTSVKVGDEVVGLLPLDTQCSGCADVCCIDECNVVVKPRRVTFSEASACLVDGIRAYTALQYLARISAGETILVLDAANSAGTILIQLAQLWGVKVIATASTQEEKLHLERLKPELVIDLSGGKKNTLLNSCLEETGGLGIDVIIDSGVSMYPNEEEDSVTGSPVKKFCQKEMFVPNKHELIMSLAVGGRWITSQHNLQLDPPDSKVLYLKGASLSFLFESFWTLSAGQQGRYLHILKDIINKVANGTLRPNISQTLKLEKVCDVYKTLSPRQVGKIIMATS